MLKGGKDKKAPKRHGPKKKKKNYGAGAFPTAPETQNSPASHDQTDGNRMRKPSVAPCVSDQREREDSEVQVEKGGTSEYGGSMKAIPGKGGSGMSTARCGRRDKQPTAKHLFFHTAV